MDTGRDAVPYDAHWPELAAHECARLATVCSGAEHIGTTAIPGAAARPVIDLLVGVRMLDRRADLLLGTLVEWGYEPAPSPMPGAIGMRRRGAVDIDLFVVERTGREWRRALALRDYLRRHADDARTYVRALEEASVAARAAGDPAVLAAGKAKAIATFGLRGERWRLTHPQG